MDTEVWTGINTKERKQKVIIWRMKRVLESKIEKRLKEQRKKDWGERKKERKKGRKDGRNYLIGWFIEFYGMSTFVGAKSIFM